MNTQALIKKYRDLNIENAIDNKKFNLYLITNHSTAIEGSTLSNIETQLLLDEGITPNGKPLEYLLMTKDHYHALLFTLDIARKKTLITIDVLKEMSSNLMQTTGAIHNTALGKVDVSKGDIRKMNVFVGKRSFPNYSKVSDLLDAFCNNLNNMLLSCQNDVVKQLEISFWAHFNFVSIHPFVDGNGRMSRLLMNYVQEYFGLPLSIVYKENKVEYFNALESARETNSISVFNSFMFEQYNKFISTEINNYKKNIKGFNLLF